MGVLRGVRLIELRRIVAVPTRPQFCGGFGANIIKVGLPGLGDDTRAWGPPFVECDGGPTQESAYYLCANRNKRSIAVDIAKPEGAQTVLDLLATCDVLVENFKPGGLDK